MTGILDAHQHFWAYNTREYGWMGPGMDALRRDHLPAELEPQLRDVGVVGTVAVQARRALTETDWLLRLAEEHGFIRGVVGWVDLRDSDLPNRLERLATHPRMVGIRELLHDMPDPDFATSPEHVRAVALLAPLDLAYDLLVRAPQLPAAIRLVDRFPEQRFILDHIAKPIMTPGSRPDDDANLAWARGLRTLAERPNVTCKLSGLVTEADWHAWRPEHIAPFLDVVLDAFEPGRVMIGSDWPVCTLAADYGRTVGLVLDYLARLSESERRAVLHDSCVRAYRLDAAHRTGPAAPRPAPDAPPLAPRENPA